MIDLHTHILSDIDDGAPDIETTIEMLQMAEKNGTQIIVATPHVIEGRWLPDWQEIQIKSEQADRLAKKTGLKVRVYPGAEVFINLDLLALFDKKGAYCINNGAYMLVELPALEIPDYTEEFFFRLQSQGIKPILAHPERNRQLRQKLNLLKNWIEKGILVQINASSINGRFGKEIAETAEKLLIHNMVHCLGSDAHGLNTRRPLLAEAVEIMEELIGKEETKLIVAENPLKVINSQEIEIKPVKELMNKSGKKNSFFGKLLKNLI